MNERLIGALMVVILASAVMLLDQIEHKDDVYSDGDYAGSSPQELAWVRKNDG